MNKPPLISQEFFLIAQFIGATVRYVDINVRSGPDESWEIGSVRASGVGMEWCAWTPHQPSVHAWQVHCFIQRHSAANPQPWDKIPEVVQNAWLAVSEAFARGTDAEAAIATCKLAVAIQRDILRRKAS